MVSIIVRHNIQCEYLRDHVKSICHQIGPGFIPVENMTGLQGFLETGLAGIAKLINFLDL